VHSALNAHMPFESAQVSSVFRLAPEQSKLARFPAAVGWQQAPEEDDGGVGAGATVLRGVGRGEVVALGVGLEVAFVSSSQRGFSFTAQNFLVHVSMSPVSRLQLHMLQPSK